MFSSKLIKIYFIRQLPFLSSANMLFLVLMLPEHTSGGNCEQIKRFHIDRASGGHRHYRRVDGDIDAGEGSINPNSKPLRSTLAVCKGHKTLSVPHRRQGRDADVRRDGFDERLRRRHEHFFRRRAQRTQKMERHHGEN